MEVRRDVQAAGKPCCPLQLRHSRCMALLLAWTRFLDQALPYRALIRVACRLSQPRCDMTLPRGGMEFARLRASRRAVVSGQQTPCCLFSSTRSLDRARSVPVYSPFA